MPPGRGGGTPLLFFLFGLAVTLGAAALFLFRPEFLAHLDDTVFDFYMGALPRRAPSTVPVIVDIDERSLALHGQWPWPRYRVARLLAGIRQLGAEVVAVDALFSEPDRTSLARMQQELRRDLDIRLSLAQETIDAADGDRALARELASGPYILSYELTFNGRPGMQGCLLHPLSVTLLERSSAPRVAPFHEADGAICNIPALSRAVDASGFFNAAADRDGVLRRVPLVIDLEGRHYPSLALAAFLEAEGLARVEAEISGSGHSLRLGSRRVPVDERGNLLLRFHRGPATFRYVSAADILDGSMEPGALSGKIVILGTSAVGLHEIRITPLGEARPGAEIHAAAVDNLVTGDFLSRPPAMRLLEISLVLFLGLAATLLLSRTRAGWGLAATACAGALAGGWSFGLFVARGTFFSPLPPLVTLAVLFPLLESVKYVREEKRALEKSRAFARAQEAIIMSMASLAETRDRETGGHIQRTRNYVVALARRLRRMPLFTALLDEDTIEMLYMVAPLHDVGKVGVRDSILRKPDRLTEDEYEEMKMHTLYASETLRAAESHLGGNPFLAMAREIAETHQEKWDGTGYPKGLRSEEIPLAGRIMAVADVYDALISRRVYKPPLSHADAVAIIRQSKGTHFDPDVVDAFLDVEEEFRLISLEYADRREGA